MGCSGSPVIWIRSHSRQSATERWARAAATPPSVALRRALTPQVNAHAGRQLAEPAVTFGTCSFEQVPCDLAAEHVGQRLAVAGDSSVQMDEVTDSIGHRFRNASAPRSSHRPWPMGPLPRCTCAKGTYACRRASNVALSQGHCRDVGPNAPRQLVATTTVRGRLRSTVVGLGDGAGGTIRADVAGCNLLDGDETTTGQDA
jgi:hypothetical protein